MVYYESWLFAPRLGMFLAYAWYRIDCHHTFGPRQWTLGIGIREVIQVESQLDKALLTSKCTSPQHTFITSNNIVESQPYIVSQWRIIIKALLCTANAPKLNASTH